MIMMHLLCMEKVYLTVSLFVWHILSLHKRKNYLSYIVTKFHLQRLFIPLLTLVQNIGAGVIVCENATICKGASIENNVTIKPGVLVSHDSKIGKHSFIAARVAIAGLVEIGECCFIGINATIRNRITIGDNVVLGMGSVALKNLNANSIYVGNPAHYLKANIDYNSSNTE